MTKRFVKCILAAVIGNATAQNVDVIADPARVAAVLSPIRRRLLQHLTQPDSASGLARKLGIPRQKINYHIRELERAGFIELFEQRQQRGCIERLVKVTARAYLISEDFLGQLAADPDQIRDSFSSAYLVAAAGRVLRDVATLRTRARNVDQKLATLGMEVEIAFSSPAEFNSFSEELATEIARLSASYNKSAAQNSRRFKLFVAAHPVITKTEREASREAAASRKKKEK
ncbi:MAG TPA: helix-turn-helix domain-containing protein [Blastocatellia bacterium]|nr:helix-turn-helix domain-containing protein [Blastocatellia bacterium]